MSTDTKAPEARVETARPRRRLDAAWVARNGVYLALVVLVLVNVVITPYFVSGSNLRLQLIQAAPVIIVSGVAAISLGVRKS